MHTRLFFGLKISRFPEWLRLVRVELAPIPWPGRLRVMATMARLLIAGPVADKALWRQRIRTCHRCPIYARTQHRCRPLPDSPLGCGCWVPLIALYEPHCWAYLNLPGESLGW